MKLNRLLVTNYLKKILITIISLSVFLTPSLAFASDSPSSQSPDPEQEPLKVESAPDPWLSLESKTMELRAADKTITDVYNILNSGLMSGSTPKLDNIYSNISSNLEFWAGNTRYSIADLQGMTWGLAQDIESDISILISQGMNLITETQRTNAKLEYVFSAIEDTINIKWYNTDYSYVGTRLSLDGSNLSSNTTSSSFFCGYTILTSENPSLYRVTLPVGRSGFPNSLPSFYTLNSITAVNNSTGSKYTVSFDDYFITVTPSGAHLYLFDFKTFGGYTYWFNIKGQTSFNFNTLWSAEIFSIPFDTLDYQIIKSAFYQAKSADSDKQSLDQLVQISVQLSTLAQSSQSGSEAAEALADYIVSPEKQAAEDASQQVINSTLNNFTGNGSGAASSSDSNSMKDISVSVKSGLNGGGSTSNATDVLNPSSVSGQTFWIWFSTTTKNNVENPYPAPVVNNTRKSSYGDEIIDTLSGYQEHLKNLLVGDPK